MGNSNLQSKKYYKNVKYRLFLPPYMPNYLHVCSNGHHLKHSTEKEKKIMFNRSKSRCTSSKLIFSYIPLIFTFDLIK